MSLHSNLHPLCSRRVNRPIVLLEPKLNCRRCRVVSAARQRTGTFLLILLISDHHMDHVSEHARIFSHKYFEQLKPMLYRFGGTWHHLLIFCHATVAERSRLVAQTAGSRQAARKRFQMPESNMRCHQCLSVDHEESASSVSAHYVLLTGDNDFRFLV